MKFYTVFFVLFLTIYLTSLISQSPDWGNDVRISLGRITCFDCDYLCDGTMFAVVQKDTVVMSPDSYPVIIYRSTNHGGSWHVFDTIQSLGKYERMKVIASELGDDYLFIFFFNVGGLFNRLCLHRYNLTAHALQSNELVYAYAWPNSFDVAQYDHNGDSTLSAIFWSEDSRLYFYRSNDRGVSWHGTYLIDAHGKAFDSDVSICQSPRNELYLSWAASVQSPLRDSINIYGWIFGSEYGNPIGDSFEIADRNLACVQPRIACSNDPNNPAIWCAYTYEYNPGQNDLDVYVASVKHPDSTIYPWTQTTIASSIYMESGADIRFYKSYGNMYVNMSYLFHDLSNDSTKIFWGWAAGSNHGTWSFQSAFINNHPCHYIPDGTNPKICYSPGAGASGSAVIYTGYLRFDLWIDAPWTLGIEETTNQELPVLSQIYPSIIKPSEPLYLILPFDCSFEASIYDISGRSIFKSGTVTGSKGINTINANNIRSGVYFIEIKFPGVGNSMERKRITVL
ncbi:T9SS type A sorting domain-containing protein [candidate division WOR-3 bacterium]|nr:T9SS type A sorting domain-containing protein [candidate division WOR-3 bacterium]